MPLLTVYLRKEPTRMPECLALERLHPGSTKRLTDIAVYRDSQCTQQMGRFGPDLSNRPRSNSRTVMLNCYRWGAVWMPPLGAQQAH